MHKENIATREAYHRLLILRVGEDVEAISCKYDGLTNPRVQIESCAKAWKQWNANEWVPLFVHTLDTSPRNWYIITELCKGTQSWPLLIDGFTLTFGFEFEYLEIDDALGVIRTKIFEDGPLPLDTQPEWAA